MIDFNLIKKIISIALPAILGFAAIIIFDIVDIYWIGKISPRSVAAAGSCSFIIWLLFSLTLMTSIGCQNLVARYLGANKDVERHDVIRESFWLSILFSFIFMFALFIFIEIIFNLMGLDDETLSLAKLYITNYIYFLPVIYIFQLQGSLFNAYADNKLSNWILAFILVLNIILDPIFIFGYLGFPALGIKGAAIATGLSTTIGLLLRGYYLYKKNYVDYQSLFQFKISQTVNILKIGIPSSLTNLVWTAVFPLLTPMITLFGMMPLAGLNIANRIEGIAYYTAEGLSIAVGTLVSNAYGRKQQKEIFAIVQNGLILISAFLFVVSCLFVFIPVALASLLNNDVEIISHASSYLRIIGYFELFLGIEIVLEGTFNGLNRSWVQMIWRVPLTLVRIPLAYFLIHNISMSVESVWWAISITTLVKGIMLFLHFLSISSKDLDFSN